MVPLGMAVAAIFARKQTTRHRCYLGFLGLLILDVGIAWFGPILFLLIMGAGE